MSTKVRLKFRCTGKAHSDELETSSINLEPVFEGSPENEDFYKWTPGGRLSMDVVNPSAADAFEVGAEYYIDITRAE